jgi:hypothetical protein
MVAGASTKELKVNGFPAFRLAGSFLYMDRAFSMRDISIFATKGSAEFDVLTAQPALSFRNHWFRHTLAAVCDGYRSGPSLLVALVSRGYTIPL